MKENIQKVLLKAVNAIYSPCVLGFWSDNNTGDYVVASKDCSGFRPIGSHRWQSWSNSGYRIYNEYLEIADHTAISLSLLKRIIRDRAPYWYSQIRSKIWYFFSYQINIKTFYLKALNKQLKPWNLVKWKDGFALAPRINYPLMIGDEMSINDPIIPLSNADKAVYGYENTVNINDLPNNVHQLVSISKQALAIRKFVENKPHTTYCSSCGPKGYGSGLSPNGSFCPECYGLGLLYTFGAQNELGEKLLHGSNIRIVDHRLSGSFQPDGLAALLALYDTYSTGVVCDIAQDYLVNHAYSVIQQTFPNATIYFTIDGKSEVDLSDFVHTDEGMLYRHFYLFQNDVYINLYTGIQETPRTETERVFSQHHLPTKHRWNVTLDILRNLCKYAQ